MIKATQIGFLPGYSVVLPKTGTTVGTFGQKTGGSRVPEFPAQQRVPSAEVREPTKEDLEKIESMKLGWKSYLMIFGIGGVAFYFIAKKFL